MSFEFLPFELLQDIFSYCCRSDQLAISLVCKRWEIAVESGLLGQTCLKVSYGVRRYGEYDHTVLIDKELVARSKRPYTCLRIEWGDREETRTMSTIRQLLDICQEQFPIQRLFVRATPNWPLAQFFMERLDWLQNLVELHVELGSAPTGESTDDAVCEISLPNLRKLTWLEIETSDSEPDSWNGWNDDHESAIFFEEWVAFALCAPKLDTLKMRVNSKLVRIPLESRLGDSDVCCLFLPSLELRTYPRLENIEITGLFELNQDHVENCENLLQNLKVLSLIKCHSNVIKQICQKCTNLKELTIDEPLEGLLSFQIAPTLTSLEKFTFKGIYHSFARNDTAVFPKLRFIQLIDMCIGLFLGNVPLVAPELTTFVAPQSDYGRLNVFHKDQIRTMAMQFDRTNCEGTPPPPNVTELLLRLPDDDSSPMVNDYLALYPNLKRLTLAGNGKVGFDGAFIRRTFPKLEYFHGHGLMLELTDFLSLTALKRIILSKIVIKKNSELQEVHLPGVEHFRAELVSVDDVKVDIFPIKTNERQPPIELVSCNDNDSNVFSTRNFRMELDPAFRHIVSTEPDPCDRIRWF